MQNIQDLKEKIFFESMNIIDNLDKISNIDELLSKQDLVDELANRISFLKLLEKNIEYFVADNTTQNPDHQYASFVSGETEHHDTGNEVMEEEAIFNNELNEIDENEVFSDEPEEEEAVFNNQLNEIVENEFHENIVSFVEENKEEKLPENIQEETPEYETLEEEAAFNNVLNEIDENEISEEQRAVLSFVDEDKILADSTPDSDEDLNEDLFYNEVTEEEAIFNNQLNEIEEQEEEEIAKSESEKETDFAVVNDAKPPVTETIPSIFDTETLDDEILIEENEEQFVASNVSIEQGEMATETSNVENILSEIKNDHSEEETKEESILAEVYDRRKIVEIDKPVPEETDKHPSDESFENLEEYHREKKIKLANIKGMKAVQSLFDDDHLELPKEEKTSPVVKEDSGSILKSNIPTNFMEADKLKPEFKLDLNDRLAFTKMLFEGSQADLNDTVYQLNQFRTLEEAKEYLSDLYYDRKWNKVDEYAQRLWILVENKFL